MTPREKHLLLLSTAIRARTGHSWLWFDASRDTRAGHGYGCYCPACDDCWRRDAAERGEPYPDVWRPERCSCGCAEDHVVAKRTTADGKTVKCWSDGTVTWAFESMRGVGRSQSRWARDRDRRAADAIAGLVCALDAAEVPVAVRAARRLARLATEHFTPRDFEAAVIGALTAKEP